MTRFEKLRLIETFVKSELEIREHSLEPESDYVRTAQYALDAISDLIQEEEVPAPEPKAKGLKLVRKSLEPGLHQAKEWIEEALDE